MEARGFIHVSFTERLFYLLLKEINRSAFIRLITAIKSVCGLFQKNILTTTPGMSGRILQKEQKFT